jgi:hypothetical protein
MIFAPSAGCEAPATTMLIVCAMSTVPNLQHRKQRKEYSKDKREHLETTLLGFCHLSAAAAILIALPRLGRKGTGFRKTR